MKILLLILLTLTTSGLFSQAGKYFIDVAAGPSIPLGKFAEKEFAHSTKYLLSEHPPGNARTGISARLTGGFHIRDNFGLLVSLRLATNKLERETIERHIIDELGPGVITIGAKRWQIVSALAGAFIENTLSTSLNYKLKLAAGAAAIKVPGYYYTWFDNSGQLPQAVQANFNGRDLPITFAAQVGAEMNYTIGKNLYTLLSADFFYSQGAYKYTVAAVGFPVPVGTRIREKHPVHSVNIIAGLGYKW